jgi:uncharacterized protein (TIGR03000 family)
MTRLIRLTVLTIVGLFFSADCVRAQGFGVGVGVYPYGSYNGFWSNGFSLYGPPVPTYGSVPGVFGGADQRLFAPNINIQNGASIGLGTPGAGGGGPRRRFYADGTAVGQPPAGGQALIDVHVPVPDAEVYFEGVNTRQAGVRRLFQSPVIQVGTTYYYKITARWKQQDGTIAEQERSVGIRANESFVVDFTPQVKVNDKQPILGVP